jgi:hypothetical protein
VAYRLLYDQKMSAFAIDNNDLLKYNAPPVERGPEQQLASIENVLSALNKPGVALSSEDKKQFSELLNLAAIYLTADLHDAPDDQVVEYYKALGEVYSAIASAGQQIAQAGIALGTSDLEALAADGMSCKAQQNVYEAALERNKTMAPQMIRQIHAAGRNIPIAFIGSYHTSGITTALQSAGIGYVVIEPRPVVPTSEGESEVFDQANHVNTRQDYLRNASLNMGFNSPTAVEVRDYLAPKIDSKISEVRADRVAIQRELSAVAGSSVDTERITSVMNNNGSLATVLISSGGNKPPPPGNFSGAFAYFEPGDGAGRKPNLVLADVRDRRWQDWDRYNFLRSTIFMIPDQRAGITVEQHLGFYQESGSPWLLYTAYDSKSKRTYCFEDTAQNVARVVAAPLMQKSGDHDLRTQVVRVIRKGRRNDG